MRVLLQMPGLAFRLLQRVQTVALKHYWLARFGRAGRGISIGLDFQAYQPERIELGHNVIIANRVTLRAMTTYPWTSPPQSFDPHIMIGDGCFINNGTQLSCIDQITLGRNVMIAENCFIADNNHGYENPALSIKEQPLTSKGPVTIGDDSWIGANSIIAGGVTIGRHCVIGANSMITRDVPDFSVAAGAPGKIIKRYEHDRGAWITTQP